MHSGIVYKLDTKNDLDKNKIDKLVTKTRKFTSYKRNNPRTSTNYMRTS